MQLLDALRPHASRPLRHAALAAGVIALTVVAQAWLLAGSLNALIIEKVSLPALAPWLTALAGVLILRAGAAALSERRAVRAGFDAVRALRARLLDALSHAGPVAGTSRPAGEVVALLNEGTRAVEPYFSRFVPARLNAVLVPALIFAVILPIDRLSAAVFLITAPLIPLFMVLIGKGAEALNLRQWSRLQRLSGQFLDSVQGLATLRAFNAGETMRARLGASAETYRRNTMSVLRLAFLSSLTLEFFATVSIAMIAVFIGFRLLWGEMGYREALFVLLLAPEFYLPLRAMGAAYHARMEALGAAGKIVALEEAWSRIPTLAPGGSIAPPASGPLRIEALSLIYPGGRPALRDVSFTVQDGQCLALTGPSGAGKSSLFTLLMGFIPPSAGRILIDGIPLETLDLKAWRARIAYVPQRPTLLNASLAQNISLGDAAPDPAKVRAVLDTVGLTKRIAALPLGSDTPVGDGGETFSGGEIHRLALARALYREAPLVLLDEPTAHLDEENAAKVRAAIRIAARGRITLIVTHDPALAAMADDVVRLEDGAIAGTRAGRPCA